MATKIRSVECLATPKILFVVKKLSLANEKVIIAELNDAQGSPIDLKGYYLPNEQLTSKQMRASKTLNQIIDSL